MGKLGEKVSEGGGCGTVFKLFEIDFVPIVKAAGYYNFVDIVFCNKLRFKPNYRDIYRTVINIVVNRLVIGKSFSFGKHTRSFSGFLRKFGNRFVYSRKLSSVYDSSACSYIGILSANRNVAQPVFRQYTENGFRILRLPVSRRNPKVSAFSLMKGHNSIRE